MRQCNVFSDSFARGILLWNSASAVVEDNEVVLCTILYCTVLYCTVQVVRCPVLYHNTSDTSETIYIEEEEEEGRYGATDPEAAPRAKSLRVKISGIVFLVLLFTSI